MENAIGVWQGQLRTTKHYTEAMLKRRIEADGVLLKRYRSCRRPAFLLLYIVMHVGVGSRQSEIGDRKLESWTLRNVEDCRF